MNDRTTTTFLQAFEASLVADGFEWQRPPQLAPIGIQPTAYARKKNVHYLVFDWSQTLSNDIQQFNAAHEAACQWVNTSSYWPKALRITVPAVQTILVTTEPFTRVMQDQVVNYLGELSLQSGVGGETSNATLIDLRRRLVIPLKAEQLWGLLVQRKLQNSVKKHAQAAFQRLPATAPIPADRPEAEDLALQPKSQISQWPPGWAWFFIVLCLILVALGGIIGALCGLAGAAYCYQISRDRSKTIGRRVLYCLGVTVGAWIIVVVVGVAIGILGVWLTLLFST